MHYDIQKLRDDAVKIFHKGLEAVEPAAAVKRNCKLENDIFTIGTTAYDLSTINDIYITGTGKASAPMAAAIEDILGDRVTTGIVNVKYGHVADVKRVKLIEAGHPVPDENGRQGARDMIDLVRKATEDDLVLCLMSGGGICASAAARRRVDAQG